MGGGWQSLVGLLPIFCSTSKAMWPMSLAVTVDHINKHWVPQVLVEARLARATLNQNKPPLQVFVQERLMELYFIFA